MSNKELSKDELWKRLHQPPDFKENCLNCVRGLFKDGGEPQPTSSCEYSVTCSAPHRQLRPMPTPNMYEWNHTFIWEYNGSE